MTWKPGDDDRRKFPAHCYDQVLDRINECHAQHGQIMEKLDRVLKVMDGNGTAGLPVRLDRLEQFNGAMIWIAAAVGGLLLKTAFEFFNHSAGW